MRGSDNPGAVRVYIWTGSLGHEWVLLNDEGGFDDPPHPAGCAVWTSNNLCDCNALEAS